MRKTITRTRNEGFVSGYKTRLPTAASRDWLSKVDPEFCAIADAYREIIRGADFSLSGGVHHPGQTRSREIAPVVRRHRVLLRKMRRPLAELPETYEDNPKVQQLKREVEGYFALMKFQTTPYDLERRWRDGDRRATARLVAVKSLATKCVTAHSGRAMFASRRMNITRR